MSSRRWSEMSLPRHQTLSDEEMKTLLTVSQHGDEEAKEKIVQNNLKLVANVVQRFMNCGYEFDDLFQVGCIGLMKAVDRFDTNLDVKFSTYAVPMIIGEIRRFLRDDSPVKVSRTLKETAYKVHKVQMDLGHTLGREPTIGEIAETMELPREEIVAALEATQSPSSLYELAYQDDGDPIYIMDQLKVENVDEAVFFERMSIKEVLDKLKPRERLIIILRFFKDKTQAEVAKMLGLSQVQVSRLEKRALQTIKEFLSNT